MSTLLPPCTPNAELAARRDAAEARLLARINYERADVMPYQGRGIKLARMQDLLARWGNPHHRLPAIHIAGTKGKGSVSTMIAAVLRASGYRTGLFTSPHLDAIEQRFNVDGLPCSAETFVQLVDEVWPHVMAMDEAAAEYGGSGPTYFEITTAMAMQHFARAPVDLAVLEVGLGGRLDSTNVCQPLVTVITSISFDHMKQLGNTLAAIAGEKAGILKPGVPVVSGVTEDEPAEVIRARAAQLGCPLVELGRGFEYTYTAPLPGDSVDSGGRLDYRPLRAGAGAACAAVDLALLGEHQARNAAVALAALAQLDAGRWPVAESALRRGLGQATLPARVEVARRSPTVVIDAAHNVASVRALVETLQTCFPPGPRLLLFATTRDKDAAGMLAELLPSFDEVALTRYQNNPRSVPAEELADVAAHFAGPPCHVFSEPAAAWHWAQQRATQAHLICATGSFFFAAEMRRLLDVASDRTT